MLYESQILNHPTSNPYQDTHTIALINQSLKVFWVQSFASPASLLLLCKSPEIMFHDYGVILPLKSIHNSSMNVLNFIYILFHNMLQ